MCVSELEIPLPVGRADNVRSAQLILCKWVWIYMFKCECVSMCVCTCECVCTHVCTHVSIQMDECVRARTLMSVCKCARRVCVCRYGRVCSKEESKTK